MALTGLDGFCGSEFWNASVTWNTESPDFTPCFEQTVLVWVPCIFLWMFSPMEVYYILHSKQKDIPWTWLNISKLILSFGQVMDSTMKNICHMIILVHCIADFVYAMIALGRQSEIYSVDIYTSIIKFLTFGLAVLFTLYNKIRGIRASGILFLFTLLLVFCGVAQFRTYVQDLVEAKAGIILYQYISYFVYYGVVVILFLLNFCADAEPRFSEYPVYENPCTESSASFPSKLTFAWFDKLAFLGWKQPLETKNLWHMNYEDTAAGVVPLFDKYWNTSLQKAARNAPSTKATFMKHSGSISFIGNGNVGPVRRASPASIVPALCKAFGPTFVFGAFLKFLQDLMAFVSPQLLKLLIAFVSGKESIWRGYLYAVLLLVAPTFQTILLSQYFYKMSLVGLRIRTALISAIYRKALRMSNSARKESTVGEIVNLMSVDAQRFMDLTTYLNMIWSAPLQIALALIFLWQTLGPSVLAGLAVMIILIPVNGCIANRVKTLQIKQMKNKDERVKLMNEILSGIKVLKLYAWEPSFQHQVLNIRGKELHVLKQAAYLGAVTSFIWSCAPFVVSLVTFAVYVFSDRNNVLDAEKAFVSLSLFNILRFPLTMLPMLITSIVQTNVSVKRLNKFMNSEELDPKCVTHEPSERDPLVIENGTFSWGETEDNSIILRNINLRIKEGQLVAVVGTVGSGKSSLLSAFLGEMDKLTGRVNTKGTIAYVPQQAWIQNATLRDNILFSKDYQASNYHKVVKACALQLDFDMLPGSDLTEIGEKGINLSGGQKQRVSLARAVYSDSEVYFLDDPLSAVDSHVGKHIFENVIGPKGVLRKKTRILVTHAITYLPEVDNIVVLKDGEISESGTYKELLAKKGAFADFLVQYLQDRDEDNDDDEDLAELKEQLIGSDIDLRRRLNRQRSSISNSSSISSLQRQRSVDSTSDQKIITDKKPPGEKLIEVEKTETGSVNWKVYIQYFQSIGAALTVATILLNVVFQVFSVGSNFWLSEWSSDKSIVVNGTADTDKTNLYLGVYAAFGAGQVLARFVSSFTWSLGCILASSWLHRIMLERILHAPSSFFDTTPVGRIINRFSKDVDTLDNVIPQIFSAFYNSFFLVVATLVVICYSTPIFIVVIIPIGIVYIFVQRFYVATSRQLKRLESVSRSPIYSHFGESVTGVQSIRAYGAQAKFIAESEQKVDLNQVCLFPSLVANRWLAVRLESVGNVIIFCAALFCVWGRETLSPGLVGLSVSYALQVTGVLNWLVRLSTDVETNIVAVERIKEYGEAPQEAPWKVSLEPPATWPDNGKVEFNNYQVRYRDGLELVLKGITFSVEGGQKVGIVGRTGAGKSSLTLCLFRLLEAAGGAIYIDGLDISKLGLHDVRSRLTIIPQDPVLFSGTLRMNLDPFDKENDDAIWKALELAHLKHFIKGLSAGLQHEVTEGGGNLSVGQRQLICLARALLRKTKVLVLDEATAAVDMETDELIQNTIRTEFRQCTVLTIAHRLNTIMDSDRVIVLDKGLLIEYDTPNNLLMSKSSVFYRMAKDAGLV